jgi:ketosteroid isomerase-like protein
VPGSGRLENVVRLAVPGDAVRRCHAEVSVMIGGLLAKQIVRRGFAALNLCDVDGAMALFTDDAVLEFPGTSALAGRYEGAEAIRHFLVERCARVERLHYTLTHVAVTETLTLGTSNTVLVEWVLVETMADGRAHHVSGVSSVHLHGGKVVRMREYLDEQDVLEQAWGQRTSAA